MNRGGHAVHAFVLLKPGSGSEADEPMGSCSHPFARCIEGHPLRRNQQL
jgi:hypothetical protein